MSEAGDFQTLKHEDQTVPANYLCASSSISDREFRKTLQSISADSSCALTVDDLLSLSGDEPPAYDDLCGEHPGSITHEDRYHPDEDELSPEIIHGFGQRLSEVCPVEFGTYFERFVRYWPRRSFHVKYEYDGGFLEKKNRRTGSSLTLFDELAVQMTERHLNHEHWRMWQQRDNSSPIWLGLHMPKFTTCDAIDIDAKQFRLGSYKTSEGDLAMPLVHLPLEHFKLLKRVYDAFPNRIWCISSETFGIHAWRVHDRPQPALLLHQQNKSRLAEIGLPSIEAHPMAGRCFRRPFGADYRTIAPNKILDSWIDQLNYFENVRTTPSFSQIFQALWAAMKDQWANFLSAAEVEGIKGGKIGDRNEFLLAYKQELSEIKEWVKAGFPLEPVLPRIQQLTAVERTMVEVFLGESAPSEIVIQETTPVANNKNVDYRNRNWTKALRKLAINGLDQPDSIGFAALEIAKWLYHVELFQLPEDERESEILKLLIGFVRTKGNGFISRLDSGQEQAVYDQVARCVESAKQLQVINRDSSLDLFARIRANLDAGKYKYPLRLVPLLENKEVQLNTNTSSFLSTSLCVSGLGEAPLPESILEKIIRHAGRQKLVPFATKLVNLIIRNEGAAYLGRPTLFKILGYENPSRLTAYLKAIEAAGVIVRGETYSKGRNGKLCSLTPWALEEMDRGNNSDLTRTS